MGLMRSWLSGTARALGVSVLVPVVVVLVLLASTVGGVGGLRSLRQLVAGPAIPDDTPRATEVAHSRSPTATLPTIPPGPSVLVSGRERPTQLGHARTRARRRATDSPGKRERTPRNGTTPATPPASGDQPQPPGDPTPRDHPLAVVRNVGERVRRAVEPLPAPIGPTASDAIETVLDIVDPPKKAAGGVLPKHGG
jgi:hypothetical protein